MASGFAQVDADRVHYVRTLTSVDQWTLGQARALPLHKFTVNDGRGTQLYVQASTGAVATMTTRTSRALAWVGVIPHWLYFAALRANQPLWYQTVVWTSAAACVVTVLGMVLGFTQFRKIRPFRLAKAIPYAGWMRWHYITGVVFGAFTLTWAFSGLLSMEPFEWTNATGLEARATFSRVGLWISRSSRLQPRFPGPPSSATIRSRRSSSLAFRTSPTSSSIRRRGWRTG